MAMILTTLAVAVLLTPRSDCAGSRAADSAFVLAEVARLKALAPPLPKGWKLYDTRQTLPDAAQSTCGAGGAPSAAPVRVEYEITALPENAPQFRIRELTGSASANQKATAPSVQKATQDLQDASRTRDMNAIKKANAEMQEAMVAMNAGTQQNLASLQEAGRLQQLPQPEPIRIQLLANYNVMDLCDQRVDVKVAGALYGFRFDKRPPCTVGPFVGATVTAAVVECFGDWRLDGDQYIANFEYVRAKHPVPFYQVYTLVAVVNGADLGAVRAAAALLNTQALAAAASGRAK